MKNCRKYFVYLLAVVTLLVLLMNICRDSVTYAGDGAGGRKKPLPAQTEDTVLTGLIWLAKHQAPDGSWGAQRFVNQCKGKKCAGDGDSEFDVALTGLSLLAFTGAGYTPTSKDTYEGCNFGDVVKKAANYLMGIQDARGVYGKVMGGKFMYNQAVAAYAMADLYSMIKDSPIGVIYKDAAQNGIDYLVSAKNPGKGWRYQPRDGQSDSSVTGWATMALIAAKNAGLNIDETVFDDIKAYYDDVTDGRTGQVGYTEIGSVAVKAEEMNDPKGLIIQPSLTAIGVIVRIFMDKDITDPVVKEGIDVILKSPPQGDSPKLGGIDYYYWHYASYCLYQYDGPDGPCWKKWNEQMKSAIIKNRRAKKLECNYGSWDPLDRWGEEGSRIYSTAINILTLEVYYRWGVVRPQKKD